MLVSIYYFYFPFSYLLSKVQTKYSSVYYLFWKDNLIVKCNNHYSICYWSMDELIVPVINIWSCSFSYPLCIHLGLKYFRLALSIDVNREIDTFEFFSRHAISTTTIKHISRNQCFLLSISTSRRWKQHFYRFWLVFEM